VSPNKIRTIDSVFEVLIEDEHCSNRIYTVVYLYVGNVRRRIRILAQIIAKRIMMKANFTFVRTGSYARQKMACDNYLQLFFQYKFYGVKGAILVFVDILSLMSRRFRLLDQHDQIDASATTNDEFWLTEDVTRTLVTK
jgi:hypothetical protein